MNVEKRIRMCQLIDKMEKNREYSKRLGLENKTSFHGCSAENMIQGR